MFLHVLNNASNEILGHVPNSNQKFGLSQYTTHCHCRTLYCNDSVTGLIVFWQVSEYHLEFSSTGKHNLKSTVETVLLKKMLP